MIQKFTKPMIAGIIGLALLIGYITLSPSSEERDLSRFKDELAQTLYSNTYLTLMYNYCNIDTATLRSDGWWGDSSNTLPPDRLKANISYLKHVTVLLYARENNIRLFKDNDNQIRLSKVVQAEDYLVAPIADKAHNDIQKDIRNYGAQYCESEAKNAYLSEKKNYEAKNNKLYKNQYINELLAI